jgi:class 3 adenylate cyclase
MQLYEMKPGKKSGYQKQSLITILTGLSCCADRRVYSLLAHYFYSPDEDISCTAVRAAASEKNLEVISHLFHLVERAKLPVKIEAIRAFSIINDPITVDKLLNYFSLFQETELKREILEAVNSIFASHRRVAELNRGILIEENQVTELKEVAVEGLVEIGDFDSLSYYIAHASSRIQKKVFLKILKKDSAPASDFLKQLEKCANTFESDVLGIFLCAYLLKSSNPKNNFLLAFLQNSKKEAIRSFLHALSHHIECVVSVKKVLRLLLLMPLRDTDTEEHVNRIIRAVLELTKRRFPRAKNELMSLTAVHLEAIFSKLSKSSLLLKNWQERSGLLAVFFSRFCEKYLSEPLIRDIQRFFKEDNGRNPEELMGRIREELKAAGKNGANQFEKFVPLFTEPERIKRYSTFSIVKHINTENPALLGRLCRVIKVIGWLEVRSAVKKIWQVLAFAREERIEHLEITCLVTQCELQAKNAVLEFQDFFRTAPKNRKLLRGFILGARFLPPKDVFDTLYSLLFKPDIDIGTKYRVLDTLKSMDLKGIEKVSSHLYRLYDESNDAELHSMAGEIISRYCDSTIFHTLMELTRKKARSAKLSGIHILKELGRRDKNAPMDVITNRLYLLLDDADRQVRVEALFALIELKDDYADKIVKDWIESNDATVLPQVIIRLKDRLTSQLFPHLLSLVHSTKTPIHDTLREAFPEICGGKYRGEARRILVEYLDHFSKEIISRHTGEKSPALDEKESLIHHPKAEFRFRREHSQVLTVFFIDIVGYTNRSTRVDMSSLISLVKTFEDIVVPVISGYNGHVIKKMGDGILAVFRHPVNAVLASIEIQDEMKNHNRYTVDEERFFVRIGLHTGPVIKKDGDIYGDVVNIASRMESAAKPGEILITEETFVDVEPYVQCRSAGKIEAKGIEGGVKAYIPERVFEITQKMLCVKKENSDALLDAGGNNTMEKLKEALFSPRFRAPGVPSHVKELFPLLQELFSDMSTVIDEFATDYHEEYLVKRYLQDKWDEMMGKLGDTKD